MKRAIKNHAGDVAAILALLVLSVAIAGYILSKERLRFPFIDSTPFTMNAEFSTAQAVTPGQGQSVRVSGVQIGEIGGVKLQNGIAVVTMQIDPKYKHLIHQNATALLRPRTGLKDMFIELNPGTTAAPTAKPGYTIPVANTAPDINTDEILSSLDADSRQYLQLLVNGAGNGLKDNGGNELAGVLERFEPTHRDLARLNSAVAVRGTDLQKLVNSLQRLNTALATKQSQIVTLVNASSRVFRAFASEDGNISRAVADLPATLNQTTATLGKVQTFAEELGPAATNLLPAARALPAANQALADLARPSAPIVKNQIRPFVVAARPVVRNLRPAALNLAKATPKLSDVFVTLNHFVNMVGFNPGDTEHGYLWWLAWLNHNARTLFSVQDANGDFRPLFLQASCATFAQLVNGTPAAAAVLNLTPILSNAGLCPQQRQAIVAAYRKYQANQSSSGNAATRAVGAITNSAGANTGAPNPLFLPKLPTK
ncbi:MAG TPA: MlaD family protein [Solirubrobacteraceae bacterium]|nr:MlaD family protein [Solirubrobacteraceae bacterium]